MMGERRSDAVVVNGWRIYAHPVFLDQVEALVAQVTSLKSRDPKNYRHRNAAKRLAAVLKLAFHDIPLDPSHVMYRQGRTLGDDRRHWYRAKFFQQYRLFYRFHSRSRLIVYAWVNDEGTKRAYGSSDDAYRVFTRMLDRNCPPDGWDELLAEAGRETGRLQRVHRQDESGGQ